MADKCWIKKPGGQPVIVRQLRQGEVDVRIGEDDRTMTLAIWRALPRWDE